MIRPFFIVISVLGIFAIAKAQNEYDKLIDVLPPSPNAASLGKFGSINPNLSTGAMSHSITLFQYESRDIKFPISLNYYSNGIKVDEIASRAGTSWNLIAGGVITRTVIGKDDLKAVRLIPPSSYPLQERETLEFFDLLNVEIENGGDADAQPDVFSYNFNGYSGRLILDENRNFVKLDHSNLKIEWIANDIIKITDGEGVEYFFGEANAKESSSTRSGTSCGKLYYQPSITAWNLSRIIHPNNDTVFLNYDRIGYYFRSGMSEVLYVPYMKPSEENGTCLCYNTKRPNLQNKKCENYIQVSSSILRSIKSSAGEELNLFYRDRSDVLGEKLIEEIRISINNNRNLIKTFKFLYNESLASKRPFLSELREIFPDLSFQSHQFFYDDINSIPLYFSFSKDHYGFFNGKSNSTLVPRPTDLFWQQKFPSANANREPDPVFGKKGTLIKIVYPTGAFDSIIYESNTFYGLITDYPPKSVISTSAYSESFPGEKSASESFKISFGQKILLSATCAFYGRPEEDDPLHNQGTVTLKNIDLERVEFTQRISEGNSILEVLDIGPGNYSLTFTATGIKVNMGGFVECMIGNAVTEHKNKIFSGTRVERIISKDLFNLPITRRFYYGELDSLSKSSFRTTIWEPQYQKMTKLYVVCQDGTPKGDPMYCHDCTVSKYEWYSMSSNTNNNIYLYPGSPVTYSAVTEGLGVDFENGGIEHKFIVRPNFPGATYFGDFIPEAPWVDNSWINGKEIFSHRFKKISGVIKSVSKAFTSFREDFCSGNAYKFAQPCAEIRHKGIFVTKNYQPYCVNVPPNPPNSLEIGAWNCQEYFYYQKWLRIDTTRVQTFDLNGERYVEEVTIYEYDNYEHTNPTKLITKSSNGKSRLVKRYYPSDLILTGPTEIARKTLVAKNMLNPVMQEETFEDGAAVMVMKKDYKINPNGIPLANSISTKVRKATTELRLQFSEYNIYGKILEQSKTNDVKEVYFWGYNSRFPVAKILNTDYNTAKGIINQDVLNNPSSDEVLRNELNKLRTQLPNARVTTYTFSTPFGISSVTNENGITVYYEYDTRGRLKLIRDKDKKIVKKFCYNLYGQIENCET